MWRGLFPASREDEVPSDTSPTACTSHRGSRRRCSACTTAIWDRTGTSTAAIPQSGKESRTSTMASYGKRTFSLKSRLLDFVRQRAVEQAERRDESPEMLQRLGRVLQSGRADHRICPPLRHLQARQPDSGRHRKLASMVNDPKRPVQFVFAGKAHPRDEPGKRDAAADRQADARPRVCRQVCLRRRLRHQRRPPLRAGRRRLAEQSQAPAGSFGHQRPKSRAERRAQPVGSGWLVGGGL